MKILVLVLFLMVGCVTIDKNYKQYRVEAFTLNVADALTVKNEYYKALKNKKKKVSEYYPWGWCDVYGRIIWTYETEGNRPDFFILGHEVWHLPELGGMFHKCLIRDSDIK